MIPGEIITPAGVHQLNVGCERISVTVANSGDRPIQVGSHYHFYEVNPALKFDREKCKGYRLDITSGTAVRFEPGQQREVALIAYRGKRRVFGFRGDVQGDL
ncbi:MAG: urease subunit beta [Colwellia sp.]|nr:urease subunit beta [Colwellia sp.]